MVQGPILFLILFRLLRGHDQIDSVVRLVLLNQSREAKVVQFVEKIAEVL